MKSAALNLVFLFAAAVISLAAASTTTFARTVPFDSGEWDIQAQEGKVVDYLGRKSLLLKGGTAFVKDSRFTDGVIEFDIALSAVRGFAGACWRMQDPENYEEFYLRPHQSGNPDANQYHPVFHGVAAWQLYHGPGYGTPVKYDY